MEVPESSKASGFKSVFSTHIDRMKKYYNYDNQEAVRRSMHQKGNKPSTRGNSQTQSNWTYNNMKFV